LDNVGINVDDDDDDIAGAGGPVEIVTDTKFAGTTGVGMGNCFKISIKSSMGNVGPAA
jgi:hypothetical protein